MAIAFWFLGQSVEVVITRQICWSSIYGFGFRVVWLEPQVEFVDLPVLHQGRRREQGEEWRAIP